MAAIHTPVPFSLCGGHPALDFVNTLDNRFVAHGPTELLRSYEDLLRFMQQSQLLTAAATRALSSAAKPAAAQRAVASAVELREATADAFYCTADSRVPPISAIRTLQRQFLSARRHQELQAAQPSKNSKGGLKLAWGWDHSAQDPELPVWMLAEGIDALMTSDSMDQVRTCAADPCRWLFLDTSKNHSRRWCDMKVCGNRMKARRFQARQDE